MKDTHGLKDMTYKDVVIIGKFSFITFYDFLKFYTFFKID